MPTLSRSLLLALTVFAPGCAIGTGLTEELGITDEVPMHLGKTAAEWAESLEAEDPKIRREATWALAALGEPSRPHVPALVRCLREGLPDDRLLAAEALASLGEVAEEATPALLASVDAPNWKVRRAACRALGKLRAQVAIPILMGHLQNDDVRWVRRAAAEALGRIGEPACSPLVSLLAGGGSPEIRGRAARALGAMGPVASPAVPVLIGCLESRDVRQHAAKALGRIGPAAFDAADALQKVLLASNLSLWTRRRAARALGSIGGAAVPALEECLHDADPLSRRYACNALASMGAQGADASAALCELLGEPSEHVRSAAARALASIGPKAVPSLIATILADDTMARHWGLDTLARIGPEAEPAVPALRQLLRPTNTDSDLWTRQRAARAVAAIGEGAVAAASALGGLLAPWPNPGYLIRVDVAQALGAIGPKAAMAGAGLRRLLDDERPEVREAARDALRKVERQL